MAEEKQAAGYVIQGAKNRFLSRSGRFVKHLDHSKRKGIKRAWVHSEEFLMRGGTWAAQATEVYPAIYDPEIEFTVITGAPVSYQDFFMIHTPTK
jgi:hypothetical protein